MTVSTCDKTFTFDELQEDHPEVFRKLNYCAGLPDYQLHNNHYSFMCSINAWRFDVLLTDEQWKAFAQLCIRYNANIAEAIRNFCFETERVTVVDGAHKSVYELPTSMSGWISNVYFHITPDGYVHS